MEFADVFANELTTAVYMYGSFAMLLILAATTCVMVRPSRQMAPSPARA